MLEIDGLTVRYGRLAAVDHASVVVQPGEFVLVTGSNGSGKSSILRAVLGLVPIAGGAIRYRGDTADDRRAMRARRRAVAYVPQRTSPGAFPLLVEELIAGVGGAQRSERELAAARSVGVADLLDRPVTTLSGGQLQRTYLARALAQLDDGGSALLADEPTSALDFDGQEEVADLLAGLAVTRLVVSHDASLVERADRVFEMAGGALRERST